MSFMMLRIPENWPNSYESAKTQALCLLVCVLTDQLGHVFSTRASSIIPAVTVNWC